MPRYYFVLILTALFVTLTAIFLVPPHVGAQALRVLTGSQGGTGIGSATAGDVGNCLKVSTNSPFAYTLGSCGSGGSSGGLATSSPWTAGQVAYVVNNGTVTSAATGTVAAGSGISVTAGQSVIGSGLTITNTGVTSLTAGGGLLQDRTTGAVTLTAKLSTSSVPTIGNLAYFTSNGTPSLLGDVATSSVTNGTGISLTGTAGALVGGTSLTINNTGVISGSCTSPISCSGTNPLSISLGTVGVGNGGTGATTFGQGWIYSDGGTGALAASTSPTVNNLTATSTTATSSIYNALSVGQYLSVGTTTPAYGYLTNDVIDAGRTLNDYVGLNVYNNSSGNCASADFPANTDGATLTSNYADFGHTSTGWTGVGCSSALTGVPANSSYIFDPNGSFSMLLASSSAATYYNWFKGGYAVGNEIMRLTNPGYLGLGSTTPWGKLSIVGNNGSTTPVLVVSTSTAAYSTSTAFIVDNNGKVGIGTTTPADTFAVAGNGFFAGKLTVAGTATSTFAGAIRLGTDMSINRNSSGYLQVQSSGVQTSLVDLEAPSSNPQEATYSAVLDHGSGNREFVDWTLEDYGVDKLVSINVAKQGTGTIRPFVIRFWNQDSGQVHAVGVPTFFTDPSGATAIGAYSSTTYSKLIPLQVASSTATKLFTVDAAVGTTRFAVLGSGNVGIGTTTPGDLLDIQGEYPNFKVYNTNTSQFAGAGFYLINQIGTMGSQAGTAFYSGINDGSATQGYFAIDKTNTTGGGTGHLLLFDYNANSTTFYTNGNANMFINSSGSVGVGSTTPWATLAVNPTAGNAANQFVVGSSTATNFIINNSGRVGIATTTMAYPLVISAPSGSGIALAVQGSNAQASIDPLQVLVGSNYGTGNGGGFSAASGNLTIKSSAAHLIFSPATVEKMRLTSGGSLGIGTSSPSNKLDVSASDAGTTLTSNGTAAASITNTNTTSNNFADLGFWTVDSVGATAVGAKISGIFTTHSSGGASAALGFFTRNAGTFAEAIRINPAGNLGIATTTPTSPLYITTSTSGSNGGITIDSSAAIQSQIDFREATTKRWGLVKDSNNNFGIFDHTNAAYRLFFNGANAGFGTTTPYSKVQITAGASATTTVTFGEIGDTSSKACYNTKNDAGSDISFFFHGTTMVIENKKCI